MRIDPGRRDKRLVLATDLDGTLVGDPESLQRLNRWIVRHREEVTVVYITGRYFESAFGLCERENLLKPDVMVCNVGAEIREPPGYDRDPAWDAIVRNGWDPGAVFKHVEKHFPNLAYYEIPTNLRLVFQTDSPLLEVRAALAASLEDAGLSATVVVSTGPFVDVVPARAGKGRALHYLMEKMGWQTASVFVCGDSGNDLDMLLLGVSGVVVGNATEEVLAVTLPEVVYRACGRCAGGIIEGLCHHGLLDEGELAD